MSFTVNDLTTASDFYRRLAPPDHETEGVFLGIPYRALLRDGEVQVCLFQQGPSHPLAAVIPTLKVDSVTAAVEQVQALGGSVLLPEQACPCTGAPFAICVDASGHQVMVKERRPA
jgi:predicted enzyme related to lactoylglutathione lyase